LPPVFNPLLPTVLRPARVADLQQLGTTANRSLLWNGVEAVRVGKEQWTLFILPEGGMNTGLQLPRSPPEPTCRCAFVLQLLSPRAARANVRQAAKAELWKLVFETMVTDLAELGSAGGLAYDVSFNKYGLRIAFLGISQTLPSYVRRIVRRLVATSPELFKGPELLPPSVTSLAIDKAKRVTGFKPGRRRSIMQELKSSTAYDAASEGIAFLRSCTGAVSFAQGDLLPGESKELVQELQEILVESLGPRARSLSEAPATPALQDILYRPIWKPRFASSCAVSGVPFMSDACGRIPR
jgi:insulysin